MHICVYVCLLCGISVWVHVGVVCGIFAYMCMYMICIYIDAYEMVYGIFTCMCSYACLCIYVCGMCECVC